MYSVVSILPSPYDLKVKSAWKDLERTCGMAPTQEPPHFTWQVGVEYDESRAEKVISEIASSLKPFKVKTSGLGLFTSMKPVVYVPISRTPQLSEVHQQLWDSLDFQSHQFTPLHDPSVWIPHIPIVDGDVEERNLRDVLARLSWQNFDWEFEVNNLALIQGDEIKFQAGLGSENCN